MVAVCPAAVTSTVKEPRDSTLDVLLDLDARVLVVDPAGGHWVRFVITRVPVLSEKPHGLDYSLTLHGPDGERLVGFDNAHPVARQKRGEPRDHRHRPRAIDPYEDMKACTMAVARGEHRIAPDEPKVWFTSTESFAKVLSAGNRDLLRVIVEQAPRSLDELPDHGQGKVQSVAYVAQDGGLWHRLPGTRRARPDHAEGDT